MFVRKTKIQIKADKICNGGNPTKSTDSFKYFLTAAKFIVLEFFSGVC